MFSGSGIKIVAGSVLPRALVASVLSPSIHASRLVVPILLSQAAAFALAAGSGKIPAFLFTIARALLTF